MKELLISVCRDLFVTVLTLNGKFGSSDVGLYEVLIFSKCITVIR